MTVTQLYTRTHKPPSTQILAKNTLPTNNQTHDRHGGNIQTHRQRTHNRETSRRRQTRLSRNTPQAQRFRYTHTHTHQRFTWEAHRERLGAKDEPAVQGHSPAPSPRTQLKLAHGSGCYEYEPF